MSPNKGFQNSQSPPTTMTKQVSNSQRLVDEAILSKATNPKALMENLHLRNYYEHMIKLEKSAARGNAFEKQSHANQQATFRQNLLDKLSTGKVDKTQKLKHDDAIHAAILKRKEDLEKEELRVELALASKTRRVKLEELNTATQDVSGGIDAFEINLKRLAKDGDAEDDEALGPSSTVSQPYEHFLKLRTAAISPAKLLNETEGYLAKVKAQRSIDVSARKEREARRRRILADQHAAAVEAEKAAASEELIASLQKQSAEETRLAARLWQLEQEKEVMRCNRILREAQYAERREKDWEDALRRETELHRSLREQYESEAAVELEAWRATQAMRAEAKKKKQTAVCEDMAWQIVMLAERIIDYRGATGAKVPKREYRSWLAMFVAGDSNLGSPVVRSALLPPPPPDVESMAPVIEDYLDTRGEFERPEPIGHNESLATMVGELAVSGAEPAQPFTPAPVTVPLKLAVVGAPFAGKTSVTQELARKFKLRRLTTEVMVAEAMLAANGYVPPPPPEVEDGAEPEAPLPPPEKVRLGQQLQELLRKGMDADDELLVRLMIVGMEESSTWVPPLDVDASKMKSKVIDPKKAASEPMVCGGFILDNFPQTVRQAKLLENALTGLDIDAEQGVLDGASRIAPPPASLLPVIDRPRLSGMDAVICLRLVNDSIALKRAVGRRLDPQTGKIYHLEFDPPPSNDPGLAARLQEVADESNDAQQVQLMLSTYAAEHEELDRWLSRFNRLRRPIEGGEPMQTVLSSAVGVVEGLLRAQAAAKAARGAAEAAQKAANAAERAAEYAGLAQGHAEAAARELLTAKKAEIQATALLNSGKNPDPAATEVLKAQAAAKCAEQLKVCRVASQDAANYAERANSAATTAAEAADRARRSLGDAEISAHAEIEAQAAANDAEVAAQGAAESARKTEAAKAVADLAVADAEKFFAATSEEVDSFLSAPTSAAAAAAAAAAPQEAEARESNSGVVVPTVPIPQPLAAALAAEFRVQEKAYLDGLALGFLGLRDSYSHVITHLSSVRKTFMAFLSRPDNRPAIVAKFQADFNAVDTDLRATREGQGELLLRSDELRDELWSLCDKKMEESEAERSRLVSDSFVHDTLAILAQQYGVLAQVELDRYCGTLTFLRAAIAAKRGFPKAGSEQPFSIMDIVNGGIPVDLKDKLEGKNALQFPEWISSLNTKCPALAVFLKVAHWSVRNVQACIEPPVEDSKRAKKEVQKPPPVVKKGKGEETEEDKVTAAATEEITAELQVVGSRETDIVMKRLQLLAEHALSMVDEISELNNVTLTQLGQCIRNLFQAECSAVSALDKFVKDAVLDCKHILPSLSFEEQGLVIDESQLLVLPSVPHPAPVAREVVPPSGLLSCSQLANVVAAFLAAAPGGFMKIVEAADMLVRMAGQGVLPLAWQSASTTGMLNALHEFDPLSSGYVDWRELSTSLLLPVFPAVSAASCQTLASASQYLASRDGNQDGYLERDEWFTAELWFQRQAFKPGGADDLDAQYSLVMGVQPPQEEFDRAVQLKTILWDLFSQLPSEGITPLLDFKATLLYLCADRDIYEGIKKAFAVVTANPADCPLAGPEHILKIAYPLGLSAGAAIHRSPLDVDAIALAVSSIFEAKGGKPGTPVAVLPEQLMYSAPGEKLVNHLMGRYQLKNPFIATRVYA